MILKRKLQNYKIIFRQLQLKHIIKINRIFIKIILLPNNNKKYTKFLLLIHN